jgi:hypothetical protein
MVDGRAAAGPAAATGLSTSRRVATVTTEEARQLLGLSSRQRVDQLYRANVLRGPKRDPRSPILIWRHSVEKERHARDAGAARGRPSVGVITGAAVNRGEEGTPPAELALAAVDELAARLDGVLFAVRELSVEVRSSVRSGLDHSEALLAALDRFAGALEDDDLPAERGDGTSADGVS